MTGGGLVHCSTAAASKNWFLKRNTKLINPSLDKPRRIERRIKYIASAIKNNFFTVTTKIQGIIKVYNEQINSNKLDNLKEILSKCQ